ncbi:MULTISPECIES: DUF1007 family protein [Vibrio]|uniref:DUF1007 family protein n=1 Tax=Vibrio TaxID=662 RepID=UPI0004922BB5|nr:MULTISPECIES: DUF1007 family protein [Vibrio]OCH56054.1 hypothetical protein A6D97_19460 [Vibrio sp. ZF57]OED69939.1 hypothetical protein A141_12060 [Vibrio crassostreae ZF-91]
MKQPFILIDVINRLSTRYVSRFSTCFRSLKGLTVGLALLCFAPNLYAHPHSWIEMKTHIEGENGMITGLSMEWSFDAMTSMYMLDGEDVSADTETETFKKLAASVIENMMYEHYFTYFYDGEEPIKYQVVENAKFERDKAKMVLTFDLPLSKPKPVTRNSLRVLIFDPSYFVDMSWLSNRDVTLSPELARQCHLELIEPNPTPEQMSYAMSLPVDADPDNTLGQLFTQSVELHCAAVPAS